MLGPWPSICVGVMVDGGCGGEYPEPPQYEPICTVHQSIDYKTEASDETKANARLIASAPDLLTSLRELLAYVEAERGWEGEPDAEPMVMRARAAISAASRKVT